jgi:hypothetical protein
MQTECAVEYVETLDADLKNRLLQSNEAFYMRFPSRN